MMHSTISTRLGGAILVLLMLLLACGGAGYYAASTLNNGLNYVTTTAWDAADGAMEGTISLQGQVIAVRAFAQESDPVKMDSLKQQMEEHATAEEEALSRMAATGLFDKKEVAELAKMRAKFAKVRDDMIGAVEEIRVNSNGETIAALYSAQQHLDETVERLLEFLANMEKIGDSKVESYSAELETVQSVAFGVLWGTVAVGFVLGVLTFLMVSATVIKPIKEVAARFMAIAEGEGDLTVSLPVKGDDEIAAVARGFNLFVSKTRNTIQKVMSAAETIGSSVDELSGISTRTSQTVDRQQQETEQVASAMNEMVATVQEVARNVSDAADAATQANNEAASGKQVVNAAIQKINRLASEVQQAAVVLQRVEQDSQKVGTVLDVIKDIAEQTNLLALNAAIEAARAGEQGRGFAVVADEVRTLAGRTQKSTEEIQKMIESLQTGTREAVDVMERGEKMTGETVEQANKAGEALQVIANAVATITNMTTQVASAADEQNAVAEEINSNIINISNLTQQTNEMSLKSSQASAQLAHLADELAAAVSHFKV